MFLFFRTIFFMLFALISSSLAAETYTVKKGDSLRKILVEHGFEGSDRDIYFEVNRIVALNSSAFKNSNPDRIYPGMQLDIPNYYPEPEPEPEPQPLPEPEPPKPVVVGTLNIQQGDVQIIRNSDTVDATNSNELYSGDRIVTAAGALSAMHMQDGSLFELGPQTEFLLDEFIPQQQSTDGVSDNESSKGNIITTLIRGVARIVTGSIGLNDKSRFMARTKVASIGIRGTDYTVRFCEGVDCGQLVGTSVAVVEGGIQLANDKGLVNINKGEFARVESADSEPFTAPLPEGFLDLNTDIREVITDKGWIETVLDTLKSLFN